MGTQPPSQKGGGAPQFSAHVYCGQTARWIKMALGVEVGLGPVHIVLGEDTAPLPEKGADPQFSAHLYCGQTAGCINMPLGLIPGDFVLDGDPAPYPKRAEPHPIFGPRLLWPSGCMDQDGTWYGGKPQPRRLCVRCGPSSPVPPPKKEAEPEWHLAWR